MNIKILIIFQNKMYCTYYIYINTHNTYFIGLIRHHIMKRIASQQSKNNYLFSNVKYIKPTKYIVYTTYLYI